MKAGFQSQSHLRSESEIRSAVFAGRYQLREMIALIQLKKYRTLRGRYHNEEEEAMMTSPVENGAREPADVSPTQRTS